MSEVEELLCIRPSSLAGSQVQMQTTQSDLAALQNRGAVSSNPFRDTASAIRPRQPMTPDAMTTAMTTNPLKSELSATETTTETTTTKQPNSAQIKAKIRAFQASAACAAENASYQPVGQITAASHEPGNEPETEHWTISENPFKRADRNKRLSELQVPSPLLQPPAIIFAKESGKVKRNTSHACPATSLALTSVDCAASDNSRVSTPLSDNVDSNCESFQKEHLSSFRRERGPLKDNLAAGDQALVHDSHAPPPISSTSSMLNIYVDLMHETLPEFTDDDCHELSFISRRTETTTAHAPDIAADDESGEFSLPSNVVNESFLSPIEAEVAAIRISPVDSRLRSSKSPLTEVSKVQLLNESDKLVDPSFEESVIDHIPPPIGSSFSISSQDSNLETEKLILHDGVFDGSLDLAASLDESMILPVERPDEFSFSSLSGKDDGSRGCCVPADSLPDACNVKPDGSEKYLLEEIDFPLHAENLTSRKADKADSNQKVYVLAEEEMETPKKPASSKSRANLPPLPDLLPEINLNLEEDWFSFASPSKPRLVAHPLDTDVFPADKSFQDFLALCVRLADEPVLPHVEVESADNVSSLASPKWNARDLPVIDELESFQYQGSQFETDLVESAVGIGEAIAEEKRLEFEGPTGRAFSSDLGEFEPSQSFGDIYFLEESPSLEAGEASFGDGCRDSLDSLNEADAIHGAEILPDDLTHPARSTKRHLRLSDSRSSMSSVLSKKSLSSLWNRKKQAAAEGVGHRIKSVRWGLARVGQLEQTKVFNPDAPAMSVPVDVAQENGILLFRFDSVSDVVVPDNLPVSINITLTYNSITSFTIPQFIVANPSVGKATEIDFECAFNLPSPSLVRRPPQLDIILRVAPIINASDTSLRIQQTPLIAQGSRSIALPALFRAKPAAPVQVRKKPTLPLGGISTRGVLIPNVRAFAMEADGECREAIWVADFGAACGGVKAKFCVKGIGIVETITKGKKVMLPDTFSEAAHGVEMKYSHESLQLKGFMSQMGGGLTNWRKRYFELLGCQLHAFNTETNNLVMTLDLALVKAIKACGVVATVTPKSQRSVGVDEDDEDKIDLTSENSIEVSRSFSESPVRRGILTATSNVDDATFCRSAHMFEIEMKDGELISFSTLGALDDEDDLPSQNNSRSVSLPRNEPWWKSGGISSPDDTFPCEPMDCVAPMLHKNFLDSDFDEVFEDIHITSPDCSARRSGFLESRGKLRDDTAPLTKRWLRAICCAATTACDETLPDWLTHY